MFRSRKYSMFKGSKTVWAVIAFIILITAMFYTEDAHAEVPTHQVGLGLGVGAAGFDRGRTQRLEYVYQGRWEAAVERFGGGDDWGAATAVSVSRVVEYRGFFGSIGASRFSREVAPADAPGDSLVSERTTFLLSVGYTWEVSPDTDIRVRWLHDSTAGRSARNSGVDRAYLSYRWRF